MTRSGESTPLAPDVGVLNLVPDTWGGPWMSRHQLLTRLARYFHVAWLEPPQEWREIWVDGELDDGGQPAETADTPGFHRVVPGRWLPKIYRPASLASLLDRLRTRKAAHVLHAANCSKIVLYIWRPEFGHAIGAVDHDLSVYHVVDDYTFSEEEEPIPAEEVRLLRDCDRVFIHSPALWERKADFNPRSIYLPNGVDYAAFSSQVAEPSDLEPISRPRVGYVGIIKKHLNFRLLSEIAEARPDWSVVLIGPVRNVSGKETQIRRLKGMDNVYFLGGKHPSQLPAYVQHLDVCTLPYELNAYTKYINPLKMYEYLAAGRPVVGMPLPSVQEHSHVISIAGSTEEWLDAADDAMTQEASSDAAVQARRSVARQYDWNMLAGRIAHVIADGLGIDLPVGAAGDVRSVLAD